MRAYGVTPDDLQKALRAADDTGNLILNPDNDGPARFTLRVKDSRGRYARRSHSGRRMVAACYHGHWAFMYALLTLQPDARIKSHMADYRGRADFLAKAPAVGGRNIGSMARPMAYGAACDCAPRPLFDGLTDTPVAVIIQKGVSND